MRKLILILVCFFFSGTVGSLKAQRPVADFQKSSKALAEHLTKVIPAGDNSEIEATIDVAILTNEFMGADAWSRMTQSERNQMSSAYRRMLNEIGLSYKSDLLPNMMRLLHLEEKGNRAEASCLFEIMPTKDVSLGDMPVKLRLLRRNDIWYLIEVVQVDIGLNIVSETLQPTIKAIEATRVGRKATSLGVSDFVRVLKLLKNDESVKAIELADRALKVKPADQGLRFLKAVALLTMEKEGAAVKLLMELSNERPAFVPAVLELADHLSGSKRKKDIKQSIDLYQQYSLLEPFDPHAYRQLARAYDRIDQPILAEAAYRKAIACNPGNTGEYVNLLLFLIIHDRLGELEAVLIAADRYKAADDDLLASTIGRLRGTLSIRDVERLVANEALRTKTSPQVNLELAGIYMREGRYLEALGLLSRSAELDNKSPQPHILMAASYRKLSDWNAALKAADQAISLDQASSDAHYQRACTLARLGRAEEAMIPLTRAVAIDPYRIGLWMSQEPDLKALASLPAFKEIVSQIKKQLELATPK